MPYVDRDQAGKITGECRQPQRDRHEFVADDDAELAAYNTPPPPVTSAAQKLADLLVQKAVISRGEADTATKGRP